VCACEPGFTCSRCRDTPFDPLYWTKEPDPLTPDEFDKLVEQYVEPWGGEWV